MKNIKTIGILIIVLTFCFQAFSQEKYIEAFSVVNNSLEKSNKDLTYNYGLRFGYIENKFSTKIGISYKNIVNLKIEEATVTETSLYGIALFSLGYAAIDRSKFGLIPHFNISYGRVISKSNSSDEVDRSKNIKAKSFITRGAQIDFNYKLTDGLTILVAPYYDYNLSNRLNYGSNYGTQVGIKLKV